MEVNGLYVIQVTIDVTSPEAGVIQKVEYRFNTGTLHFLSQVSYSFVILISIDFAFALEH